MTSRPERAGFTIYEAMMVLLIVGIVVGSLMPSVRRQLTRARMNRAANVMAADLMLAQSIAGRQRVPVRVEYDVGDRRMTIVDSRPAATNYLTRRFGPNSDFKLQVIAMTATPTLLLVLPNGTTSAGLTVTLTDGTFQRRITMTRAGLIRVT